MSIVSSKIQEQRIQQDSNFVVNFFNSSVQKVETSFKEVLVKVAGGVQSRLCKSENERLLLANL